jgi:hypothetical protein
MAHMKNKKGEFRRGFGKGPKRKELKPRELPGGRDVLLPIGRLCIAMKSKHLKRCEVDPRLVPIMESVLSEAMGKGISVKKEIGNPPPCPTSVISSALSEGDRILSMGKRLGHVVGKREAKELSAALEATMPKLVGMKRLCA